MSVERFLLFWSHHNQTIIQVLIVLTLLFIVALVFLTLFGSKDEFSEKGSAAQISPDLEKSLQRMLENQAQAKSAVFDFSKGEANAPVVSNANNSAAHQEAMDQLEKVKAEMAAREKSIQDLKTQLEAAQSASQAAPASNNSGLEARIKELEARLSEYDIISEDIADLSKFKEENEKLKKQLSQLASAPVAAAPKPVETAPLPDLPPEPAGTPKLEVEPATEPVAASAPHLEVVTEPTPEVVTEPPPEDPEVNSAIDDDLMKEFAAAVESQKAATSAANPIQAPPASAESEDLMGQFENFVQKKEGS